MKRTLEEMLLGTGIDQLARTPHGFKGCCSINPLHIDSKPSMHIHVEKGYVKCFSCGAFKPLFNYLLENGVSFDEAIDFMFTDFKKDREATEGMQEWVLGRAIPKSFLDRGFEIATLQHFGVGFDEVENRITMPLKYNGILYGVGYRQYPKKIWNSSGFNKDNFVYNYQPTEERIYVEGFTDTWRAWQNGTDEVSALLTAFPSEGQLALMSKHKHIKIGLDNDYAGWKGAFKINMELGRELEISMIPYKAHDAGECPKDEWLRAVENYTSFTEFEVMMIKKNPDIYARIMKELKQDTNEKRN